MHGLDRVARPVAQQPDGVLDRARGRPGGSRGLGLLALELELGHRGSPSSPGLVPVPLLPGHLVAEPSGRLELVGRRARRRTRPRRPAGPSSSPAVDVELDLEPAVRDQVAGLGQPPALGQRPQRLEPLAVELDLLLGARRAPVPPLTVSSSSSACGAGAPRRRPRRRRAPGSPARSRPPRGRSRSGRSLDQELALDLHPAIPRAGRWANSSASNGRRSSIPSPTPISFTGIPSSPGDRERDPALRRPVELRQHDAGDVDRVGERARLAQPVLAGGRVDHDQRLVRRAVEPLGRHPPDLGQLLHQVAVGVQAPGGVDDHHVGVRGPRPRRASRRRPRPGRRPALPLTISVPARSAQVSSCSIAAAR